MTMSNFSGGFKDGISIRGMPLAVTHPGKVFWVANNPDAMLPNQQYGSDSNNGSFNSPFATLAYALTQTRQGRGDVIMVKPGHRESIPDASTLAMNCNGVAIVGLGSGARRPTFTFTTAATANIPIRSSSMTVYNCLFQANFADIASVFTGIRGSSATSTIADYDGKYGLLTTVGAVTGSFYPGATVMGTGVTKGTFIVSQLSGTAQGIGTYLVYPTQTVSSTTITAGTHDFTLDSCEFRDLSSVLNFLTIVTGNATANSMDGLTLVNNRISSLGTTAATTAIVLSSATDRMKHTSNFGCWAVLNDTAAWLAAGANNMTNFEFGNNILERPNTSSTGGSFISTSATAWTGHAYNNLMYQLDNTAGIWIATGTGGAFGFSNNYSPITGAVDKSALINPAAV
jgi:hypothetical protein